MSDSPSVLTYLTKELRELIRLGPVHAYTWVSRSDPGRWMQVSVHDGHEHYLSVLCVLPPDVTVEQVDRALGKVGRTQKQANEGTCLIYYLAQCDGAAKLLDLAPSAAEQCAALAGLLWGAATLQDFELLGARGPKLPFYGGVLPLPPGSVRE